MHSNHGDFQSRHNELVKHDPTFTQKKLGKERNLCGFSPPRPTWYFFGRSDVPTSLEEIPLGVVLEAEVPFSKVFIIFVVGYYLGSRANVKKNSNRNVPTVTCCIQARCIQARCVIFQALCRLLLDRYKRSARNRSASIRLELVKMVNTGRLPTLMLLVVAPCASFLCSGPSMTTLPLKCSSSRLRPRSSPVSHCATCGAARAHAPFSLNGSYRYVLTMCLVFPSLTRTYLFTSARYAGSHPPLCPSGTAATGNSCCVIEPCRRRLHCSLARPLPHCRP